MLGLSESMTGKSIGLRLKRASGRRRFFIPRKEFQEFLREHGDFCMQVVRLLSEDLHGLYHKFRSIRAHPGRPRRRALDEHTQLAVSPQLSVTALAKRASSRQSTQD